FDVTPDNLPARLQSRLSDDALQIQNAVNRQLATIAQFVATVVSALAIALSYGWKLTLVLLTVSPLIYFSGMFSFRGQFGSNSQSKADFAHANGLATEAIANIKTVSAFTGERAVLRRFDDAMRRVGQAMGRSALIQGVGFGFSNGIGFAI